MREKKTLFWVGLALVVLGIVCIVIKGFTPEYVDAAGVLHEYFFLLPVGFGSTFAGLVVLLIDGVKKMVRKHKR